MILDSYDVAAIIGIIIFSFGLWWILEIVRRSIYPSDPYEKALKEVEDIQKKDQKIKENPLNSTYIGTNGYKKKLHVSNNANHVFVCGTTGSGKTVVLANFIKTGIHENFPMLIIDGKGDVGEGSILDIVLKMKNHRKVFIIDFNNPKRSNFYNPFWNTSPTIIKDMLINLTEWSEEHYKLNAERYLQRLTQLLNMAGIQMSFKSIVEGISVDKFKKLSATLLRAETISKEMHEANMEIAKECGAIAMQAAARFSILLESELGSIFDVSGVDISTALKQNDIILFILNPLIYPELSPLIGNLIVIDSKKAVSSLYTAKVDRTFFIMDEINVYASKSLLDLVNKSRSANITCVLATQSLSDLDAVNGEAFKNQIIENCNNYIVLRQNSAVNAEAWADIIGTKKAVEMTHQFKSESASTTGTGLGSMRIVREYIFHPDVIKNLPRGEGIFVCKDKGYKTKLQVHKPF